MNLQYSKRFDDKKYKYNIFVYIGNDGKCIVNILKYCKAYIDNYGIFFGNLNNEKHFLCKEIPYDKISLIGNDYNELIKILGKKRVRKLIEELKIGLVEFL